MWYHRGVATAISAGGMLLLMGCADVGTSSTVLRLDSAGIELVESAFPLWGDSAKWSVGTSPLIDLARSGSGSEYEFFRIQDAVRLRNGSIAVANSGTSEVRLYSAEGAFLRSLGSAGEGSGEFEGIETLSMYRGGSVLAFDRSRRRVTVVDGALQLGRTLEPYGGTSPLEE